MLVLFGVLLSGCATPANLALVQEPVVAAEPEVVVENPIALELPVRLAAIEDPPRFWKYPPLKPYGNVLGVINNTGYALQMFDLFNEQLYQMQKQQVNLLSEELEDGSRALIQLDAYPELLAELHKKDGSKFHFNARSWDDDLYWGDWNPGQEDWNLFISSEHLEREGDANDEVESFGSSLVIANATGYPLKQLFLEHKRMNLMDGSEVNLLEDQVLQSGKRARIQVSDLPHLAEQLSFDAYATLTVSAYDTDGDLYVKYWHPTTDLWLIELDNADMQRADFESQQLLVENRSGTSLWFVYIVPEDLYAMGDLGDDVLGMDIIGDGESLHIDLSELAVLQDIIGTDVETVVHVVAEDVEGNVQHATFSLGDLYPSVLFEPSAADLLIEEAGEELTLYNDTPADLWFLYLATDEMVKDADFGRDLLRDGIWEMQEEFTFKVSPVWVENHPVLHLFAYDYWDNEYHKEWKVSDGWSLSFNADDLSGE